MDAETLDRLHEEYRRAVEAARDETASPEAQKSAATALIDSRHALDAGLIEAQHEREDAERTLQVEEAKRRAKLIVAGQPKPEANPFPLEDIRAYGKSARHGDKLSFTIPFAGMVAPGIAHQFTRPQGADWTTSDATTYSSYTVPQRWASDLYMYQIAQSGVLAAGPQILATANGNQINYPRLVTDMTSNAGTEGSAATETNPVFGTTPLNSYRIDGWTPIADELFRDSGVDIEAVLRELALRSLAAKAAPYYGDEDIGTGDSLPAAITIGTTAGKTAAGTDSVTLDELKELMYSVLPVYRAVGRWIANSDITLEVALAKDGEGRYMMQPSASAEDPDRVFGKPWYEDAYFDASASGGKVVVFGDIRSAYIVRRIGGIQVDLSRDFAFTSFETTARWAMWHDAATIDAIAAKHIVLT